MTDGKNSAERDERIEDLLNSVERLSAHNLELKTLILRYGDSHLKSRLEKIMKKYSGESYRNDAA